MHGYLGRFVGVILEGNKFIKIYPLIKNTTPGLEVNRKGGIVVNEAGLTSHQNVYAGGDAVTGAATVILAMGAGKLGAKSIDEALSK